MALSSNVCLLSGLAERSGGTRDQRDFTRHGARRRGATESQSTAASESKILSEEFVSEQHREPISLFFV